MTRGAVASARAETVAAPGDVNADKKPACSLRMPRLPSANVTTLNATATERVGIFREASGITLSF
jgi:hypothetical protein